MNPTFARGLRIAVACLRFAGHLALIVISGLIWFVKELLSQPPQSSADAESCDIHESGTDAASTERHGYIGDHDTYPTKIRHYDS
jgi:hypothetical protein